MKARYPVFDYIRLFLALEVVGLHIHGFESNWTTMLWIPLPAVPAFLALSGFMVLGSLQSSASISQFWMKRAFRILPAFLASFCLVLALHGGYGLWLALLSYASFGFLEYGSPNTPLWSLSTEEVVYAGLCGLFVLGFYKKLSNPIVAALTSLLVAIIATQLFASHVVRLLILIAPFFIGNVLYLAREKKPPEWLGISLLALVATVILLAHPTYGNSYAPVLAALAAAGAVLTGQSTVKIPKLPADISYGVYIYHFPILSWLELNGLSGVTFGICGLVLTIGVAVLSFLFIEKPALEFKERWLRRLNTTPLGSEVALVEVTRSTD